jgi:predicted permease
VVPNDLRFAVRQLFRNPGLTAVVVLSVALGVGANTTVLCWLRQLVQCPLPGVARQEEIVVLVSNTGGGGISRLDAEDFSRLDRVLGGVAISQTSSAALTVGNRTEWIEGQVVGAGFFDLLEVRPILGRTFHPDEDRKPGGDALLVIGERLWRSRFAADPGIVGRNVELNRHAFTVIGVFPEVFRGTMTASRFDFWAPASMIAEVRNQRLEGRSARGWHNVARLRPGIALAQARAEVAVLDAQLAARHPDTNRETRHRLLPYSECPWGSQTVMGPVLRLLLAVCLGVLLIVVANVANLQLARASTRRKEFAIRLAAGASRPRLVRQLLTESVLLAGLGGLAGTGLAAWAIDRLPVFLPDLPPGVDLRFALDGSTLGWTLLLTLGAGIAFGLAPALQTSRASTREALQEDGRAHSGSVRQQRLRRLLVITEIALALVLLVGAALCLRGMERARKVDLGLNPAGVVLGRLQIGMNGHDEKSGQRFYRELRQRLAVTPGVEEAALASWFPLGLSGCKSWDVVAEGYDRPPGEDPAHEYVIVSPRYFATTRTALLAGRDFAETDDAEAQRVAIVNEAFARHFWPGQDPLGRRFRVGGTWRTIVGVARTTKYHRLDETPRRFFFLPYLQGVPDLDLGVCVRVAGSAAAFAPTLQRVVHAVDPGVELVRVLPLSDHTQMAGFTQTLASGVVTLLGGVALILAAMGVYAVMAYTVSQRTREFGIRLALGAQPRELARHVLGQGLLLALGGIASGLVLAAFSTRLLGAFLLGISPFDPLTFAGVAILLAAVALAAAYLPARRASRVAPLEAIRTV